MSPLFKQNRIFFICYLMLAVFGSCILLAYSKADGFILFNPVHTGALDYFFIPYTYLGNGFFVAVVAAVLFFKDRFSAIMILAAFALSGIISQILKYFILEARPAYYLEKSGYPYFIDGVTLHNFHSFPSGHTASAFALAAILSFSVKNKKYSLLFLLLAAGVGYSRMYLGQHFIGDVLAGSLIGILSAFVCWVYLGKAVHTVLK